MTEQPAVSKSEFEKVQQWFDQNQAVVPENIAGSLRRILAVYQNLSLGASRAKKVLQALRQAMGILPKSERGSTDQAKLPDPPPSLDDLDPETREKYEAILKKRAELAQKKKEYDRDLKRLGPKEKSKQLELPLDSAYEMMFSYSSSFREDVNQKQVVPRMQEFGKDRGLQVSYDYTKRIDLKVVVSEIKYKVETVTDPETGKSVRASMREEGPEGFEVTWGAIANLIKMHVGFAIPINRISMMIGQREFSSSKICRLLEFAARRYLALYLVLFDQLSDVFFFSGDDTPTKVIDLEEEDEQSLSRQIDEQLGWISPRADGNGDKKAVNVSLLIGRTEGDPRSTIRFFRTHVGSVGNLLGKLLELRSPQLKKLVFQGDLSSANLPRDPKVLALFDIQIAGCAAHARRPFWRYREDDPSLCYYLLKGFLKLARLERIIDFKGRTRANVLKYRGRYGRLLWHAMKNRCEAAVTGHVPGFATYPKGITPDIWPPDTDLYKASMYVINHFEELTLYLDVPELSYTNNGSERALRIEKIMLDGSKFRRTRNGRAVLDILRTINATCTAARIDIDVHLRYVEKHLEEYLAYPERFTPFEVAKRIERERTAQNPASPSTDDYRSDGDCLQQH